MLSRQTRMTAGGCAALGLVVLASCAQPAPAIEEDGIYTLRVADSYPPGHPFSDAGAMVLMDRAEELTDGRVQFEYFPAEQMGAAENLPSLVRSGVVDVGAVAPAYAPAELPLSGVADLPGLVTDSCTGSVAVSHLMQEGEVLFEEDFEPKGLRPLVVGMIPDYEVMTGSKPVDDPEDLDGTQLRSSGGTIDRTVSGLGSTPVGMPATEMYEAISRGTVDGTVLGPVSAAPYHLDEVTKYSTQGARLGSFTMTYSIGEAAWDELPAELQDAVAQAGNEATRSLCAALQKGNEEGQKALEEGGVEMHEISGAEREKWDAVTAPIQDRWAEDMNEIDRPGDRALEALQDELEKVRDEQTR